MSAGSSFSRRQWMTSTAAVLVTERAAHSAAARNPLQSDFGQPNRVTIFTEQTSESLTRNGSNWQGRVAEVRMTGRSDEWLVWLGCHDPVLRIHLRWEIAVPLDLQFLGDEWERSYGTLAWRGMEPERIMPWYFLAHDGMSTVAVGVKTGANALCFWQVDPAGISLWLDVRNGGRGVRLGDRELQASTIATEFYADITPFLAAQRFCHRLSPAPRLPAAPVYGGNNWYYAYGNSSADNIRGDSERLSSLATSHENRPFMVIDDGWSPNATAGPWSHGNAKFPDMPKLASDMEKIGVRPGLWLRPLFTKEQIPAQWRLNSPNTAREYSGSQGFTIDPTVPEALEKVKQDMRTAAGWGYQLLKHDFSTYDLFGRWGFNMGAEITDPDWNFADRSRTNAEITRDFYRALREAAGSTMLLGCNTVGHLSAGIFELQRTGDDTSGRDWNRTRKMGVNTLAFRAPQHNAFFAVDADCVGLTKQIPWKFNRQWLDLLARSGTPLFVSIAPDALGSEQRSALREAFTRTSRAMPLLEPADWLQTTEPQKWRRGEEVLSYNWFGTEGVSPFASY